MLRLFPSQNARPLEIQCAVSQKTYTSHHTESSTTVRSKVLQTTPETIVYRKELLGRGGSSQTYVGMDTRSHSFFLLKEIAVKKQKSSASRPGGNNVNKRCGNVSRETAAAKLIDLYGGVFRTLSNPHKTKVFLFQNLFSGTIRECVESMSTTAPREIIVPYIALEITRELQRLESAQILHFDINPSNICYSSEKGLIEFIDFGCSAIGTADFPGGSTEPYCTFRHQEGDRCNFRDNIFSLGATFCELALGASPFGFHRNSSNQETERLSQAFISQFEVKAQFFTQFKRNSAPADTTQHLERYFADLHGFSPALSALCDKMLDQTNYPLFSSEDVMRELNALVDGLSPNNLDLVRDAWKNLAPFNTTITRQKLALELEWQNIHAGNRKLLREKKLGWFS